MKSLTKLQENWQKFSEKEMDRKEFLTYMASAIFAVSGIALLTNMLEDQAPSVSSRQSTNYSSGTYGGSGQRNK